MSDSSSIRILYPVFAMFLLVALVLFTMRSIPFAPVPPGEVSIKYYRGFQGAEPETLRVVARQFANLFEVPVLFYVVVLMAYVSHQVTTWLVGCAWTYVALRYAHSYVHLTSNDVRVRFGV